MPTTCWAWFNSSSSSWFWVRVMHRDPDYISVRLVDYATTINNMQLDSLAWQPAGLGCELPVRPSAAIWPRLLSGRYTAYRSRLVLWCPGCDSQLRGVVKSCDKTTDSLGMTIFCEDGTNLNSMLVCLGFVKSTIRRESKRSRGRTQIPTLSFSTR